MWREWFPIENEYRVEQRKDIAKWAIITLSFPMGNRFAGGNMVATGLCPSFCLNHSFSLL